MALTGRVIGTVVRVTDATSCPSVTLPLLRARFARLPRALPDWPLVAPVSALPRPLTLPCRPAACVRRNLSHALHRKSLLRLPRNCAHGRLSPQQEHNTVSSGARVRPAGPRDVHQTAAPLLPRCRTGSVRAVRPREADDGVIRGNVQDVCIPSLVSELQWRAKARLSAHPENRRSESPHANRHT